MTLLLSTLLLADAAVPDNPDYNHFIDQLLVGDDTVSVRGSGFWLRVQCDTAPWLHPCSRSESWYLFAGKQPLSDTLVRAFHIRSPVTGQSTSILRTNALLESR